MAEVNSGPIPGANMTSDTKNYPWHQPPKFNDIDNAIDFLVKKMTDFKRANAVLTMIEVGVTVVKASQIILMQGVAQGYWSVDFALLLVGPLTRMLELICIGYDVKYDLGIDEDPDDFETATFFQKNQALKAPIGGFKLLSSDVSEIKDAASSQDDSSGDSGGGGGMDTSGQEEQPLQNSGFMAMTAPAGADSGATKQGASKGK